MGNPQAVWLVESLDTREMLRVGAALQQHPAFPDAVNLELARVVLARRGRDPHLRTRRRSHALLRHRLVRRGRRGRRVRRRRARRRRGRPGRPSARRVARRWGVPDRVGGSPVRRDLAGVRTLDEATRAVETLLARGRGIQPQAPHLGPAARAARLRAHVAGAAACAWPGPPDWPPSSRWWSCSGSPRRCPWRSPRCSVRSSRSCVQVAPARARARAVRRSDHLPVHRQLHPRRGDVRARPRPAHRVHRPRLAVGRHERDAHPRRLRPGRHRASRCG